MTNPGWIMLVVCTDEGLQTSCQPLMDGCNREPRQVKNGSWQRSVPKDYSTFQFNVPELRHSLGSADKKERRNLQLNKDMVLLSDVWTSSVGSVSQLFHLKGQFIYSSSSSYSSVLHPDSFRVGYISCRGLSFQYNGTRWN